VTILYYIARDTHPSSLPGLRTYLFGFRHRQTPTEGETRRRPGGVLRSAAGVWRQLMTAPLTELIVEDSRSRDSDEFRRSSHVLASVRNWKMLLT